MTNVIVLRAARWVDADAAQVHSPAVIVVDSDRMRIACGTDAPAIPHGRNAKELWALVDRGMTPLQAIRAATATSAELIDAEHELGRFAPGYRADIVAAPGDPSRDISTTLDIRFVMENGRIHKVPRQRSHLAGDPASRQGMHDLPCRVVEESGGRERSPDPFRPLAAAKPVRCQVLDANDNYLITLTPKASAAVMCSAPSSKERDE